MNDTPSDHFSAHVGQADFDALVLKQSYSVPVLADFWAAWCGPCKVLMPLLAKIAQEYQGKFFLAKIDTDKEKDLATRYAIRSLPTVKIFKQGQVVDEFMGAQPEPAIRTILDRHIPRASDVLITQALAAQTQGDTPQALALLTRAVETDPDSDRPKLQLAQLLFESQRYDEGEKFCNDCRSRGVPIHRLKDCLRASNLYAWQRAALRNKNWKTPLPPTPMITVPATPWPPASWSRVTTNRH